MWTVWLCDVHTCQVINDICHTVLVKIDTGFHKIARRCLCKWFTDLIWIDWLVRIVSSQYSTGFKIRSIPESINRPFENPFLKDPCQRSVSFTDRSELKSNLFNCLKHSWTYKHPAVNINIWYNHSSTTYCSHKSFIGSINTFQTSHLIGLGRNVCDVQVIEVGWEVTDAYVMLDVILDLHIRWLVQRQINHH